MGYPPPDWPPEGRRGWRQELGALFLEPDNHCPADGGKPGNLVGEHGTFWPTFSPPIASSVVGLIGHAQVVPKHVPLVDVEVRHSNSSGVSAA